ncbi:FAR-17a/AIG1-like protein [Mycena rebaudengoi]|nr:FAR-17a/AIG1-like protein [Mycena rebaudengoi]
MTTHALQRVRSSSRSISTIIHVAGLIFFAAAFSWLPNITNPLHNEFGGPYQFLTFIALTISTITFGVGLLADVSRSEKLFSLKNILSVCATPLEVLVSILYWGLRAVDKRLVVPPGHELPFIPDFGFHAMPAVMLTLDLILLSPPWSIEAYSAMTLGSVLIFMYWGWIEYCFSLNGWYPYPLLMLLSSWQKLLLCIIAAALMMGSTMVLKLVYGRVNEEFTKVKID